MQSCDTVAINKEYSKYNKIIFAKNSDRPVGESHRLVFYKGKTYEKGERLACTHIKVEQCEKTYSVIGSKPYWIWGFEMGINEWGLFIGNEAQGSKNAESGKDGLLGMDMLRIALERSKNCREAINTITSLLTKYGQYANASMLFDRRYENSYMLADNNEIWVLETAGREWAAKRIDTYKGISNCYSIESDFELSSDKLIEVAEENDWYDKNEKFNFAKAYTLPAVRQTYANSRYYRLNDLLAQTSKHSFDSVKKILRDHNENTIEAPRFEAEAGTFYTICMHPQTWDASKTTASMIAYSDDVLGLVMRYAFSVPCTSVYLPFYFTEYIPEKMQNADETFDEKSLWWCVERLSVLCSVSSSFVKKKIKDELAEFENKIEQLTFDIEEKAKKLIKEGNAVKCCEILNNHMDYCVGKWYNAVNELFEFSLNELKQKGKITGPCREVALWISDRYKMQLI